MLVAIDREERGQEGSLSAVQALEADHGIPVYSIVTFSEILEFVEETQSQKRLMQCWPIEKPTAFRRQRWSSRFR